MGKTNHDIYFWNGQTLEIIGADKKSYFTKIIQYEHALLTERPVNTLQLPLQIENGMTVTVYFYDESNQLYTFNARIYSLQDKKTLIEKPVRSAVEKAQRRGFFRIEVAVPMDLFIAHPNKPEQMIELNTHTYDIGGGGVSFLSTENIVEEGDIVEGKLYLNRKERSSIVKFKGKVVRLLHMPNEINRIAIEFIEMKESTRTQIIQFCMFKQSELRNKIRRV